jgi:hypothetical protein
VLNGLQSRAWIDRRRHRKETHQKRRRECKADPGSNRPGPTRAMQSDQKAYLAARWSRQQLAQADQPAVLVTTEPAELTNVRSLEIPEVGNRSTEGSQPQPECDQQDLACGSFWVRGGVCCGSDIQTREGGCGLIEAGMRDVYAAPILPGFLHRRVGAGEAEREG